MIDSVVTVIGGGPAGLMAAETLSKAGIAVAVYDRMPSLGRKFLMAGRGGLNLTHSEPIEAFLGRYGAAKPVLAPAIEAFPPAALRDWAEGLGQPTFIGSSGRVFPRSMKASPLLRAWLSRLQAQGVRFHPRHEWLGWDESGRLSFRGRESVSATAAILALGGGSYAKLGSDGAWVDILSRRGASLVPLRPANCGFKVAWSDVFRQRFAGQPIKNLALSFGGRIVRGEVTITDYGIEGGAVYTLSSLLRDAIAEQGHSVLHIDLCPDRSAEELTQRLAQPRRAQSLSNFLRRTLNLPPVSINLLREAEGPDLAARIKALPITLIAPAPMERAISTAGGIDLADLDENFMLRRLPGVFAAGEMLDWEAPTGGYLLQGAFATGMAAAKGVLAWLASRGGVSLN